jgi:hypothetical protein
VAADGVVGPKTLAAVARATGQQVTKADLADADTVAELTAQAQQNRPAPPPKPLPSKKPPKAPAKAPPPPRSTVSPGESLVVKQAAVKDGWEQLGAYAQVQMARLPGKKIPMQWVRDDKADYNKRILDDGHRGLMSQTQFWAMPLSLLQQQVARAVAAGKKTIVQRVDLYAMTPEQYVAKYPHLRPQLAQIRATHNRGLAGAFYFAAPAMAFEGPAVAIL